MRITKNQLKQIIKEELSGIMEAELPGEADVGEPLTSTFTGDLWPEVETTIEPPVQKQALRPNDIRRLLKTYPLGEATLSRGLELAGVSPSQAGRLLGQRGGRERLQQIAAEFGYNAEDPRASDFSAYPEYDLSGLQFSDKGILLPPTEGQSFQGLSVAQMRRQGLLNDDPPTAVVDAPTEATPTPPTEATPTPPIETEPEQRPIADTTEPVDESDQMIKESFRRFLK